MALETCPGCNGNGYIDEVDAQRIGVTLGDARTQLCPFCDGAGELNEGGCGVFVVCALIGLAMWAALVAWGASFFR